MLHKNVIGKKSGFRVLDAFEVEAVSGGFGGHFDDDVLHLHGDAAKNPGGNEGDGSILGQIGDFFDSISDAFFGDQEEENRHREEMARIEAEDREAERDAEGQMMRDCIAAGGNWQSTESNSSTGGEVNVDANVRGLPVGASGSANHSNGESGSSCTQPSGG